MAHEQSIILLTGGTGYIGGRLLPLPGTTRSAGAVPVPAAGTVAVPCGRRRRRWSEGDVLAPDSLAAAMQGVHTAYYLDPLPGNQAGLRAG